MLLEKLEGQTLIVKNDLIVEGERLFTKGNKTILLYAEDKDSLFMVINEEGREHFFSYNELDKYFIFEKEIAFNYQQHWIEEEREQNNPKQSITFKNRFRYKNQIKVAIGDIVTVKYRSELYSDEPIIYTGELIGLEDDGVWVTVDGRGEWFSYCDVDEIIVD